MALTPSIAFASSDTRSIAMGGVGVASSGYLNASFHNPALAAKYGENDNFGMILPVVGARIHDGDDLIDKIDRFQDLDDLLDMNPNDPEFTEEWRRALKDLDNGVLSSDVNIAMVAAIPNKYLAANFFVGGELSVLARTSVADEDLTASHGDGFVA